MYAQKTFGKSRTQITNQHAKTKKDIPNGTNCRRVSNIFSR